MQLFRVEIDFASKQEERNLIEAYGLQRRTMNDADGPLIQLL